MPKPPKPKTKRTTEVFTLPQGDISKVENLVGFISKPGMSASGASFEAHQAQLFEMLRNWVFNGVKNGSLPLKGIFKNTQERLQVRVEWEFSERKARIPKVFEFSLRLAPLGR